MNGIPQYYDKIPEGEPTWLHRGFIVEHDVNLLVAKRKMGKGHICRDYAARVSRGWPPPPYDVLDPTAPGMSDDDPDARTPGQVIMITPEDHPEFVVKPGLIAAGADTTKILNLTRVSRGGARNADTVSSRFSVPGDLGILKSEIRNAGDVRLIIIDPANAVVKRTMAFNQQLRIHVVEPLQEVCYDTGATIVLVTHFNKGVTLANMEDRVSGSGGLLDAARITNVIVEHPIDPDRRVYVNFLNSYMSQHAIDPIEYTIGGEGARSFVRWDMPLPNISPENRDRLRAWLIAVLIEAGRPMSLQELASFTRLPFDVVKSLIKQCEEDNGVKKVRGAYINHPALAPGGGNETVLSRGGDASRAGL